MNQSTCQAFNETSAFRSFGALLASFCTSNLASVLGVIDLHVEIHTSETNQYYIFFLFDDQ